VLFAQFAQAPRQTEFDLHELGFRGIEFQEILCAANLSSSLRKLPCSLRFHGQFPWS
jgi:hypothetical protein